MKVVKLETDLKPISRSFYARPTLTVARELLGKYLVRSQPDVWLIGKIVEVEAYIGEEDPACHAARGKTQRNAVMYGPPGFAYIYFIYGMYYCLNVVTERAGFPAAVLIRALEPVAGLPLMKQNRRTRRVRQLTNGPGKLCQAFALDKNLSGKDLCGSELFIANGETVLEGDIVSDARVGIKVGTEYPWRFYLNSNPFVSKK